MATLEQLTSAVYNNLVNGLKGTSANVSFTHQQIEDSIINERLAIIKEYSAKNLLPKKDLLMAINCITLDCQPIERCISNCSITGETYIQHFEIPQFIVDFGNEGIDYCGTKDRMNQFKVYIDKQFVYNKYRIRRANKPYVWIDVAPNKNGKYDGYIFNAPMLEGISIVFIPKDPRDLLLYDCCNQDEVTNFSFFAKELEDRTTAKFLKPFRQLLIPNTPNTQAPVV